MSVGGEIMKYKLVIIRKRGNKIIDSQNRVFKTQKDVQGFRQWVKNIYPSNSYKVSLKRVK